MRLKQITITLFLLTLAGISFNTVNAQELHIDIKEKTLDNGLKILVWERPSASRIGTRMFYKVDIAAERPGTVGLTHMLEHHLFKGSDLAGTSSWEEEREVAHRVEILEKEITDEKNRNRDCFIQRYVFAELEAECTTARLDSLEQELLAATQFQNSLAHTTWYDWAVQSAGGTNSTASTGRDWMKFDIDLPANKLELFMWTERSRIEHPVFRHFEPEKEVVVDQIRRYDNRPDGKFSRVMRSITYDAHPYGWAHWFSDLTRATREDHWEIFYKYFIPQNAIIVVVGEVDAEEVFEIAEKYWGSWQKGRPSPRLRTVEPEPVGQKRLLVEAASGPAVAINVPMPAVGHPDAAVFDIIAELIGGTGGYLESELIDKQGVATRVGASAWTSKYPSHFEIRVDGRSNDELDQIETGINSVLKTIADREVTDDEIRAARSRLVLNMSRSLDEVGRSAVVIGGMESIYGWEYLNELPALWAAVTPDDLSRIAKTYFSSHMQTVGHLKRSEQAEGTAEVLSEKVADRNEFGRHDSSLLNRVRPGSWAFGGPVGEYFLNPVIKQPSAMFKKTVTELEGQNIESGESEVSGARFLNKNQENETLAIAEQPWYSPPWMAGRRPAGFSEPMPVDHYSKLEYEALDFTLPLSQEHELTLENNFRAYIAEQPLLQMVQLTLFVESPERYEPAGKEGISALAARLVRSGAEGLSSSELNSELNRLGASLQVQTTRNGLRMQSIAPVDSYEGVIHLIGTLLARPDFDSAFESQQTRYAAQVDREAENAAVQVRSLFENELYGDSHRYGRRATSATVNNITVDDLKAWYDQYFHAGNMTLAVSGAVGRSDFSDAIRRSDFSTLRTEGLEMESAAKELPEVQSPEGIRVLTKDIDTRQGHVMLGHVGIEGVPEDHAALEVMHHILAGGGFISRMMELLRTQTGITSALFGEVEPGLDTPNPYLWRFGGNPGTLVDGVVLALEEIRKMHETGLTEEEFEAARTAYIDGLIPGSYETPQKTVERMAHKALFGLYPYQSPQYLNYYAGSEDQMNALRQLTLDDVNRAAKKYLDPDNLIITIAGPMEEILEPVSDEVKLMLGL